MSQVEEQDYEIGRSLPIRSRGQKYDGPTEDILGSSGGWIWWAKPHVTRWMWHSSRHYDNLKTWEDLVAEEGTLRLVYRRGDGPVFSELPKVDEQGEVWVREDA